MPKTKSRKTYKCGKCQATGHNARTCKAVKSPVTAVVELPVEPPVEPPVELPVEETKVEPTPVVVPMDETQDLTKTRRGTSGRPTAPPAPYTCPSCSQIGVLVLVEYADGKTALRCENCRNSTPIVKILKWGALPADKPA